MAKQPLTVELDEDVLDPGVLVSALITPQDSPAKL